LKYVIHKGKHRAWPLSFGLYWNKKHIERDVVFDQTCKYDLPGVYDDGDINKLFGIGYFPGHHTDSARFGWVYNNSSGKIDLYAYCYVNGERIFKFLCDVRLHQRVRCMIDVIGDVYSLTVIDAFNSYFIYGGLDIKHDHYKKLGYKLSCYFGGNNTAPHTINIEIKKK